MYLPVHEVFASRTRLGPAHYRAGLEKGFQVIKFGGIFIWHLILRILRSGLRLFAWQRLPSCAAAFSLQRRTSLLLSGSSSAGTPSSIQAPMCTASFQEVCSRSPAAWNRILEA